MVNVIFLADSLLCKIFFISCGTACCICPVIIYYFAILVCQCISSNFSFCVEPVFYFSFKNFFTMLDSSADTLLAKVDKFSYRFFCFCFCFFNFLPKRKRFKNFKRGPFFTLPRTLHFVQSFRDIRSKCP